MNTVELLPFDTNLFGFKTGAINLGKIEAMPQSVAKALAEAKEQGYRLVYIKYSAPSELNINIPGVEVYYDTKVTFTLPVVELEGKPVDSAISEYKADGDISKELYELAYTSGQNSRYKLDGHFPENVFVDMYDIWLQKSVNKDIASNVMVYTKENEILGFVTLDMRAESHSRIGLIGVNAHSQGMGIGRKLINATVVETKNNNKENILVDTQLRNEQACNFYLKNGFTVFSTEYIINCWI